MIRCSNLIFVEKQMKQIKQKYKMGPIVSKKQPSPTEELKMSHPRFNKARLIKENEQIQISLPFMDQKEVKQWQQKFKKYVNQDCLLLPTSYQSIKSGMCGNSGVCKVRFQNYPYVLKDQINDRIVNNLQTFQNKEIWYILFIVLEAASLFHQSKLKLGDIRPINIFISDNGQTKVASQFTFLNENANFQKSLLEKEITYVAPEQMKHLLFKSFSNENFILAESFSIGLTLVDAATLSNSEDIYNLSNFRIDYDKLAERIQKLKKNQKLDQILKQIILGLASVNHEERLNCDEVFKWLKAFKEEILNFEPFQIVQWPFVNYNHENKTLAPQQQTTIFKPVDSPPNPVKLSQTLNISFENRSRLDNMPKTEIISNISIPAYRNPQIPTTYEYKSINTIQTNGTYGSGVRQHAPIYGQFRMRLQKIDQQLAKSKELFPS